MNKVETRIIKIKIKKLRTNDTITAKDLFTMRRIVE